MAAFSSGAVTVGFDVDRDAYDESREARVAVQEIPGGDAFYADRAGRRPQTIKLGMLLANSTAWGQINSVLGQSGTLTPDVGDTHAVILMRLSRPTPELDGHTKATAEFLVTDS